MLLLLLEGTFEALFLPICEDRADYLKDSSPLPAASKTTFHLKLYQQPWKAANLLPYGDAAKTSE